ncbi:MAG: CoA transferase, partial [Acidimicrobiales bacterium]
MGTPQSSSAPEGALGDLLVLDLSRVLAGPYAAMLLSDLGARVIKVERPGGGDDTRHWGPPFIGPPGQLESTYYLSANRNKESIVLDLKSAGDRPMLEALLDRADVLVENFRPGVLDRLGLGHQAMRGTHPHLIILSISGFGPDGPEASRPGYDQIVQGEAGLMSLTGEDPEHPQRMGLPVSDLLTGIFGALGVVAALHQRASTGEGQVVNASLLASSVAVHSFQGTRWLLAGQVPSPQGNHHPTVAPYGAFHCRDGMLQVAVGNDALWRSFAPLVGLDPDDSRFADNARRQAHREALEGLLEDRFGQEDLAHWLSRLTEVGVPVGEIKTLDSVYASSQVLSQGLVVETEHPTLGLLRLPGPALRMEHGMRHRHLAPPRLGEHTAAVKKWLDQRYSQGAKEDGAAASEGGGEGETSPGAVLTAAMSTGAVLDTLVDPLSFVSWDTEVTSTDLLEFTGSVGYTERLEQESARSGASESVLTGKATVEGRAVALVLSEPGFMAGTMGVVAGERIAAALERATALRLPTVAVAASGGVRVQEGPVALAQMAKTAAAARRYRDSGGCLVLYLSHPAVGGILASWGLLGTFEFSTPHALPGTASRAVRSFGTGPPVTRAPQAEDLLAIGGLDDVFPVGELRERVVRILEVVRSAPASPPRASLADGSRGMRPRERETVARAREAGRLGSHEVLASCATDLTVLHGDGAGGEDDPSCLSAICRFLGTPAAVVAQVHEGPGTALARPAGFRKARRLFRLAEELGLP